MSIVSKIGAAAVSAGAWVRARLREPSTVAGIGVAAVAAGEVIERAGPNLTTGVFVAAGVAGAIAIVKAEVGPGLAALVDALSPSITAGVTRGLVARGKGG